MSETSRGDAGARGGASEDGRDWSKERVVVTGGAGFLGSFVLEELAGAGRARCSCPARASTTWWTWRR